MTAGFYGLVMLFYTQTIYPGQGTDGEGRPGLGDALTYAPRPCPVDVFGRSAVALAAYFNVISVS